MTIPEAAQLVIQAGAMGQGGDVFVLDMGEPIKIVDLAKRMIHLSGLEVKDELHPEGEVEIVFTGLRPGEKLYEELLIGDNVSGTTHCRIMRAEEDIIPWSKLNEQLDRLKQAIEHDDCLAMRAILTESVSGFVPQCEVSDWLWLAERDLK
jgi:FlaA1/EpsC-like NDP-sugar epimerase